MKKFFLALKENTGGIRKRVAITALTVVGSVVAGVVLTKLVDENTPVLILEAAPVPVEEPAANEF